MLWVKKETTHLNLQCRIFLGNEDISEGPKIKT